MIEQEPDTDNVVYLDEHRKARWFRILENARNVGGVATFHYEYTEPAKIIPFPDKPPDPDDAA